MPVPAPMIHAVGYVRVSMAREEMISPELQKTAISDRAARDGAVITEWIEELDVSGRGFGRKGVQRAISLVRDGVVRRVYVWKYSRFGRNATYVGVHVGEMEAAAGQLVSATEDIDPRTAAGKFARGMLWRVDEFVSDNIGEQWKEAHARRRRNGLPHNGAPRFGYLYHKPTSDRSRCPQGCGRGECEPGYVADPATEDAAEWAYKAYNSGTSVLKIAVALNQRGFTTGTGKPWGQRSVRLYMDSGFCAGLLRFHDPACECSLDHCPNKVLVPGAHAPVISEKTWREYLRQRKARRSDPPRVEAAVYPLAGLLTHAGCGAAMHAHGMRYQRKDGLVYKPGYIYQCSKYMKSRGCDGAWVTRHRVEAAIQGWLLSFGDDASRRAAARRGRARVRDTAAADRIRLSADAARTENALTELTLQLARKVIEPEEYTAARDELKAKRAQTGAALEALAASAARASEPPVKVALSLAANWDYLEARERQILLRKIVDRIEVTSHGGGKASITVVSGWGEVYVLDV
jgi:site-specific DNA recombinase